MHRDFPRRLHQLVDSGRSRFYGAVMFADVSSYTVYAESACTRGIAGVEGLADEMRRMFDDCRDTVTRHDGEIVSFIGDAFLAFWPADQPGDVAASVKQAKVCAACLRDRVATQDRLSFRIGIGHGSLWADRFPAGKRMFALLGGVAVKDALTAARDAKPGRSRTQPLVRPLSRPDDRRGGSGDASPVFPQPGDAQPQFAGRMCALGVRIEDVRIDADDDESVREAVKRCTEVVAAIDRALCQEEIPEHGSLGFDERAGADSRRHGREVDLVFTLCRHVPHDSDICPTVDAALRIRDALKGKAPQSVAGLSLDDGVWMPDGDSFRAVGRFLHVAARLRTEADRGGVLVTSVLADYLLRDGRFHLRPWREPCVPRNMTRYIWPQKVERKE